MRKKLVAGNWKMHGSAAQNAELLAGVKAALAAEQGAQFAVCPPFPYLEAVGRLLAGSNIRLGAQNVSEHTSGAYTGEVAAAMLSECGCHFVLVGHSERRTLYAENDAVVAAKFKAVQAAGMVPILCVGETLAEREGGRTDAVIQRQISAVINSAGIAAFAQAVVAYEPVWAIGTGKTASPEQAQAVHAAIRAQIAAADAGIAAALKILYGGSVKPDNAAALFALPDVDGGLIGGASLQVDNFAAICKAAVV